MRIPKRNRTKRIKLEGIPRLVTKTNDTLDHGFALSGFIKNKNQTKQKKRDNNIKNGLILFSRCKKGSRNRKALEVTKSYNQKVKS